MSQQLMNRINQYLKNEGKSAFRNLRWIAQNNLENYVFEPKSQCNCNYPLCTEYGVNILRTKKLLLMYCDKHCPVPSLVLQYLYPKTVEKNGIL